MIHFIDAHRTTFGVEPICQTLQVAPSSHYAARSRPTSARQVNDATLADIIGRVHRANFGVYGVRKVWKALRRLGVEAGRDQVARIMRAVDLQGPPARRRGAPPDPPPSSGVRPTWCSARSPRPPRTGCGWPT